MRETTSTAESRRRAPGSRRASPRRGVGPPGPREWSEAARGLTSGPRPDPLPEEELRWLEEFVTDPALPGGTWHPAVYGKPTDTLGEGAPGALWGVWSDAGGAASPNDPGALLVGLAAKDGAQGKALADLVLLAHEYLPRLVREIRRLRDDPARAEGRPPPERAGR